MDYRKASELEEMIENEMFYGIPIRDIDDDMMECMDTEELRELYIVVNMLHWKAIDNLVLAKSC